MHRRKLLRPLAHLALPLVALLAGTGACAITPSPKVEHAWESAPAQTWVGPEFWANRLQDWRLADGRVECIGTSLPYRTLHNTTRRVSVDRGTIEMTARLGVLADAESEVAAGAEAGFLIGAGAPDLDWRAACLVQSAPGPDGGWLCGISAKGRLFIRDFLDERSPEISATIGEFRRVDEVELTLLVEPELGLSARMTLIARTVTDGRELARITRREVDGIDLAGNLALFSHPAPGQNATGWWFDHWGYSGTRLDRHDDREIGPIVAAFHTLSRGTVKMTAQLMPLAITAGDSVRLEVREGLDWREVARAPIDPESRTAHLRVDGWDATRDIDYRVRYGDSTYGGTVRRDPVAQNELVVAGLSCNHLNRHGFGRAGYPWSDNALWFPHADLTERLEQHDPDVLFFAGDQIYEGASPTPPDRTGAPTLDYLYKWTLFCLAFGDVARDRPTITIPDDHDVYQGNLWGAGGRATKRDNRGGYVMPAEWVRMVERTQTWHLPDPVDPEPVEQGIGVYFTDLVYGGVGLAVLEDRKFKSGCADMELGGPRPDHIVDAGFDPTRADLPDKALLGERQLAFLDRWARDWEGQEMKLALSQTVFANVATHHGSGQDELVADLDSNGWPQAGRNRAIDALRKGFALHIAGDQHLSTLVHHGVEEYDDGNWTFTVPAIANFYARSYRPAGPADITLEGLPDFTGSRRDGFGNKVTVWAATNPDGATGHEPAALHDQMPGYGIVRVDKRERAYVVECWPRHADPHDEAQYAGWPKTIPQREQYGRAAAAWLPVLALDEWEDPAVQVFDDQGELVYALRPGTKRFHPFVFAFGTYEVRVGDPEAHLWTTLRLGAGGQTTETVRVPYPDVSR